MFGDRLYNFNNTGKPDQTMDKNYREQLRALCHETTNGTNWVNLETTNPDHFDNSYFTSLQQGKGLLQSDQELFSTPNADTIEIVERFRDQSVFFEAFIESMIKMGNINLLTESEGEVRANCRRINGAHSIQRKDGFVSSV